MDELKLLHSRHAKFFQRTLAVLPSSCQHLDTQRVTIAFFAISGLDLLDKLELVGEVRGEMVEWLYKCLVISDLDQSRHWSGFRGATSLKLSSDCDLAPSHAHDHGHIAMTYTALASLLVLGDDLARVDRAAVLSGVRALQLQNGSFRAALEGGENDMRFLYCAASICYMLDDWSGMNTESALQYVISSISYEGGVGQGPGLEAHGGSTYCAVAALSMMNRLQDLGDKRLENMTRWCIMRQEGGFCGRPNKPEDTCYSFWVGATLSILDKLGLTDTGASRQFVLSTQDAVTGGLAKWVDTSPDSLHTYLGLSGLGLQGEEGVASVHAGLNISVRAKQWLEQVQSSW